MTPETAKRLRDARKYALELQEFIAGRSDEDFIDDRGLQLIVHKLLEIVGEALNGARKSEPTVAEVIPNVHRYVALRNQVTHGYDSVDYPVLWNVAQVEVPRLIDDLDNVLRDIQLPE